MMKPAGCAHAADHGKRLVIKIGSSTLTTSESKIDYAYLAEVTDQVARVRAAGWRFEILSRGVSVVFCAESDISVREGLYSPHYGTVVKSSILDVPFEYGRTNVITVREILNED